MVRSSAPGKCMCLWIRGLYAYRVVICNVNQLCTQCAATYAWPQQ